MPRNVTVTFGDGSSHVYNGVPDDVTPDAVISRAGKEFPSLQIKNIDGGKGAAPEMQRPMIMPYAEGDPELSIKDVGQAARGAAAEVLGTPGSIEQLVRRGTSALGITDPKSPTILPTPEDIEKKFGPVPPNGREAGYRQLGGATADIGMMVAPLLDAVEVAPAIGRGAAALGRAAMGAAEKTPIVGKAIGRESAAARGEVATQTREHIGALQADATRNIAEKKALDAATEGRPNATVLEVKTPTRVDVSKVTEARAATRAAQQKVTEATTKLQEAQRRMSSVDKYAGTRRSEAMIRSARRDLNVAQRDANAAELERDRAMSAQKEIEGEHRAAMTEQRKSQAREVTSAKSIENAGKQARQQLDSLKIWSSRLNAAKDANGVAQVARKMADQMLKAGNLSESAHTEFLRRVNNMVGQADSTAKARAELLRIIKAAGLLGIGAYGGSYLIRTFH